MNESELLTFIIFVLVAIVRTIIDVVLWQILVWILNDNSPIVRFFKRFNLNEYAIAQAISFLVSAVISYVSNKEITFSNSEPDSLELIVRFSVVTGIGLVASVWAIEFLTTFPRILKKVHKYPLIEKYWPLIAKLVTVGITLVINYIGLRFWVF